ncbi:hypothetical protein AB0J82_08600 [Asanoa sp. NPDC049518]|uniref:hypothetical protein n=1 Tax=unclassified Asanoa TaxID=2685164 RepID=UPI00342F6EBF
MHAFVAEWYADVPPSSPFVMVAPLPRPLLEFYRAARGRQQVLGEQNRIFSPEEIYPSDDGPGIVIGSENQGVFRLRVDPSADDPSVWYLDPFDSPVAERVPLSGFLVRFLLCEAVYGPYGGWASVRLGELGELLGQLEEVPLPPMRWPSDPTHHYVAPGVVVMVCDLGDGDAEVYVGSRHRAALRPFRTPGFAWQAFNG